MKATMILDQIEQLNAISNPKRLTILKALVNKPLSPSELAEQVNIKSSQLYYHLNALVELGLVEIVEEKQVRNLIERVYRATARHYSLASELLPRVEFDGGAQIMQSLESFFEITLQEVGAGLSEKRLSQSDDSLWMMHRGIYLRPSERVAFIQKLRALLAEYADEKDGADAITLTCVGYVSNASSTEHGEQ